MRCYPTKPPKALMRIWTNRFKEMHQKSCPSRSFLLSVIFGYFFVVNRQTMGWCIYICVSWCLGVLRVCVQRQWDHVYCHAKETALLLHTVTGALVHQPVKEVCSYLINVSYLYNKNNSFYGLYLALLQWKMFYFLLGCSKKKLWCYWGEEWKGGFCEQIDN